MIEKVYYSRVSTKKDEQDSSIIHQEEYFKSKGISKGYIDRSSGTTIDKRIEFQKLLEDCGLNIKKVKSGTRYKYVVVESMRASKIKYIYTKSLNRFARNVSECIDITRMLKSKGVYVVFEDIGKSTEDESFFITMGIMATMAEQESREKSRSIKMGANMSAKSGVVRSWSAYGYEYKKESNTLVAIPQESEIIKKIFDLKLLGYGGKRISKELNSLGYKTRNNGNWLPHVINRIVKNPIYTGVTVRNRYNTNKLFGNNNHKLKPEEEWILVDNDKIEPIISKDVFEKCQKIRKKMTNKASKVGVYKGISEYAQKIICDKCGEYYTRNKDVKVRDYGIYERVFFNCSTKKRFGVANCDNRNISQEEIDNLLKVYIGKNKYKNVCKRFYEGIFIPISNEHINKLMQSLDKNYDFEIDNNKNKIAEYKEKLSKLLDLYLDSTIDKDILENKKKPLEIEIKMLENKNKKLSESNEEIMSKIKYIRELQNELEIYVERVPTYINREDFIENYLVAIIVKNNNKLSVLTQIHYMLLTLDKIVKGYIEGNDYFSKLDTIIS